MTFCFIISIFYFIPLCELKKCPPTWRVLPIRSNEEFGLGMIGGEAEQHNHACARSVSNPNVMYLSHDCGHVWRSENAGESWKKTLNINLTALAGQSIEIDPVKSSKLFIIMNSAWNWLNRDGEGIYSSVDSGNTWKFVKHVRTGSSRRYEHNLEYDPKTIVKGKGAKVWYAAIWNGDGVEDYGVYKSEDFGESFQFLTKITNENTDRYYSIYVHPSENLLFVASNTGLYRVSEDSDAVSVNKIGSNLPGDVITALQINPQDPNEMFVVVQKVGLFKSSDMGESFENVKSSSSAELVFLNPGFPNELYLVGSNQPSQSQFSSDSGATFRDISLNPAPGLGRQYKRRMGGAMTGIMPNPKKAGHAVGYTYAAIWRTENGTKWNDSSTLWTGFNCGIYTRTMSFDESNPQRFMSFMADVGMIVTENNGDWFDHVPIPWEFYDSYKLIDWISMGPGYLYPDGGRAISSVGNVFNKRIIYSTEKEAGVGGSLEWMIYGYENSDATAMNNVNPKASNWRIFKHPVEDVVFVGSKRSIAGSQGTQWEDIPFLSSQNLMIVGCSTPSEADEFVIFAVDEDRQLLYRSYNSGLDWQLYYTTPSAMSGVDSIPVIEIHPSNPDVFFALQYRTDIYKYDGSSFSPMNLTRFVEDDNNGLVNFPQRIMFDPSDENKLYVGFFLSGSRTILIRSSDGGKTWQDISYNLPRLPVGSINVNPHTGEIFRGACDGHFVFLHPDDRRKGVDYVYDKAIEIDKCSKEKATSKGNAAAAVTVVLLLLFCCVVLIVMAVAVAVIFYFVKRGKT